MTGRFIARTTALFRKTGQLVIFAERKAETLGEAQRHALDQYNQTRRKEQEALCVFSTVVLDLSFLEDVSYAHSWGYWHNGEVSYRVEQVLEPHQNLTLPHTLSAHPAHENPADGDPAGAT